jgi:hypothetical protein
VIFALAASVGVQAVARTFARVQFAPRSLGGVFADVLDPVGMLPAALIAVFCMRAALVGGWRSVRLVLAATLLPVGFLTYQGELASLGALASDSWTAAGLASGLVTFACIFVVALAGSLALWASDRRSRSRSDDFDEAGGMVEPRSRWRSSSARYRSVPATRRAHSALGSGAS